MTHILALLRRSRALPAALLSVVTVLGLLVLVSATSATASNTEAARSVPAPPANPTSADQIQNIDQVRTAIKGYYGDTPTSTPDPVDGAKTLHTFSLTGSYAKEMAAVEQNAAKWLAHPRKGHDYPVPPNQGPKAVLLDIDDTTLNTFNYEIYSNFAFNPATNAAFVNSAAFPAVPGMPTLVNQAVGQGYTIFFLTGRPEGQRPGTVTNLANAGYPSVPSGHLFLKDQVNQPWLASCSPTCTTIQYKSLTRKHIEKDLGFDIVANFGDQFSDLAGGYADQTFKLPNPMYFLP
ncbi:MAG: acid phosphatase [Jatrophihabitans sp.]|nr:acid phosphatase [Jatrophihabitans sp.]